MLRQNTQLDSLMIFLTKPLDDIINEKNLISMFADLLTDRNDQIDCHITFFEWTFNETL